MGKIINLIMALFATMFLLGATVGSAYAEQGMSAKEVAAKVEGDYSSRLSNWLKPHTPGDKWEKQLALDYANSAYSFSCTLIAWGTDYGYKNQSKAYAWLSTAPLILAFGAEFLFLLQYGVAMAWIGIEKAFGVTL